MVKFPLCAVRVIGAYAFARLDAANLDVERVSLVEIGGSRFATKRDRDVFARPTEFSAWRYAELFYEIVRVDLAHANFGEVDDGSTGEVSRLLDYDSF